MKNFVVNLVDGKSEKSGKEYHVLVVSLCDIEIARVFLNDKDFTLIQLLNK